MLTKRKADSGDEIVARGLSIIDGNNGALMGCFCNRFQVTNACPGERFILAEDQQEDLRS